MTNEQFAAFLETQRYALEKISANVRNTYYELRKEHGATDEDLHYNDPAWEIASFVADLHTQIGLLRARE